MSRIAIAFFLALGACTYAGWDDVPGARVHPVGDDPAWWAEVATAVAVWNQMAREHDCPQPFVMSLETDGAHPIIFVPLAEWRFKEDAIGVYHDEYEDDIGTIYIRDRNRDSYRNILLHELGHGIGLTHDETPGDIMNLKVPELEVPSPHDVERMRGELGC